MENSKYRVLNEWLRKRIAALPANSRIESENELAARFDFSRQTVRRALEILENEGLIRRTRGSGTYTLDNYPPRHNPTMSIAVIMTYVDDYIFPRMIAAIERVFRRSGYTMQLMFTHNRIDLERAALTSILAGGVDAVIAEPTKSALPGMNDGIYRQLLEQQLPCLFINAWYPALDCPRVVVDDRKGGKIAAEKLAANGHQQLGAMFKADDLQGHLRFQGFCDGLLTSGLIYDDDHVVWFSTEDLEDLFGGSHDDYFLKRFAGCTGLVCYNDQLASRLIGLFARHGYKCPDDLSIVSFDDSSLAGANALNLTSLPHPSELMGEEAAARILQLLAKRGEDVSFTFEPYLIERGSVKKLSAAPLPVISRPVAVARILDVENNQDNQQQRNQK